MIKSKSRSKSRIEHVPRWLAWLMCIAVHISSPLSLSADELPKRITIATWNLEWFYDHHTGDNASELAREQSAPNRGQWEWRLAITADAIAKLDATIVCLQEVESRGTIAKLCKRLKDEHKLDYRTAFVEGNDVYTEQDVCVLAQSGLIEYGRKEQSREMFDSKEFYNLSKHVFCKFQWGSGSEGVALTLLNVHQRAQDDGASIRRRQAKLAHFWLESQINAGENVVLIGDTNTEFAAEKAAADNDLGILRGLHTASRKDDLFDCHELLKPEDRATHLVGKPLDRILISEPLRARPTGRKGLILKTVSNRKDLCIRGKGPDDDHWNKYYQIPQDERDVSDHFPIVAEFEVTP
jgi:endonuclease/exonuclease/phosphatase family metal-dependent hydrolase